MPHLQQFDDCGLPLLPVGPCVSLVRIYRLPIVLADGELNPEIQQVVEKDFLWRGYSFSPSAPAITIRLRGVNNYYLSNMPILLPALARGGTNGRALQPEMFVPKGDAITVEAQNSTGDAISTFIDFIGVDLEAASE